MVDWLQFYLELIVTSREWQIFHNYSGSVLVVIVWLLDLQLLVQSVSITTKVMSSNPVHGEVYSIQHYVIKFVSG
jgi:hypothetical protein